MTDSSHASHSTQKRRIILTVFVLLFAVLIVLALFLNKISSSRELSFSELRTHGAIIFDQPRIIENFSLIDHNGEAFNLASLQQGWTLIFFGFTFCPDICPNTMAKLADVYKKLDRNTQKDLNIVMVSVDPARDTTEKLGNYVPYFHPEFRGVTGDFLEIMKVSQNVNAAFSKVPMGESYTIDHTANIAIIDPDGHYYGFLRPPFRLEKLILILKNLVRA
jgi:protein SCO1/2